MSNDYGTIAKNNIEVLESPLLILPGVNDWQRIQVAGTGTLASPTMALYQGTTDVSSTYLSGSLSVSGRTIKTKTISNLIGGNTYRAYVYFTDGGLATVREYDIICPKLGVRPSKFQFAQDKYRVDESPVTILPGQSLTFSLSVSGYGTLASVTMYLYKGLTDDSATSLSGVVSISGRTITLQTIGSLVGGAEYIAYVFFTDDGKSTCRYFEIICPKLGSL